MIIVKIKDGVPTGEPRAIEIPDGTRDGKIRRLYGAVRYVQPEYNPQKDTLGALVLVGNVATRAITSRVLEDVRDARLYELEMAVQKIIEAGYLHVASGDRYRIDLTDLAVKYFAAKEGMLDPVEVVKIDGTTRFVRATAFLSVAGAVLTVLRDTLVQKEVRAQAIRNASTVEAVLAVDFTF